MVVRKITKFLRGKATRGQVLTASVLAGMLGFVPGFFLPSDLGGGFLQAPGLILSLFFLALICNANLGVFTLMTVVAKLASFALLPITFAIGRWMIEGPMRGVVQSLANAPFTAWFGLEYYATTGGLVVGLLFGIASGIGLFSSLQAYRNRMASIEAGSTAYQQYAKKWYVKLLTWLFLGGGKGNKVTWAELAEGGKKGLPIRIGGVVLVVGIGWWIWSSHSKLTEGALTTGAQSALVSMNGATVDLDSVKIDFADGSLRVKELAISDASALDTNLFETTEITAQIDTGALLRRRFVIENLVAKDSKNGNKRATPGKLVTPPSPPPPPPTDGTTKTLEDYLKDVEVWRTRIEQASEWFEKLTGGDTEKPEPKTEEQKQQEIEQAIQDVGLAKVFAKDLRADQPAVWIKNIEIGGIASANAPGGSFDLRMTNWSSNPWLLADAPKITITSKDTSMNAELSGPSMSAGGGGLALSMKSLSVDSMFANIKTSGAAPVRGGTMDLDIKGSLLKTKGAPVALDLPINVTMKDTTFALAGAKETKVDSLTLPLTVSGPASRPSVRIEDKALADALVKAGKQELANFVNAQAGKLLGGIPQLDGVLDANKSVGENLDAAKQRAEEEAKKALDQAKQQAEAEAQKAIDAAKLKAEEAAKKALEDAAKKAAEDAAKKAAADKLKGGLKGLIPGGGKKDGV